MITTCVILNYNDYQTTINLVNKIKDFPVFDYIVVVDNFSTDNSYYYLKKYGNNKIIVIRTEKNGGYGYGNNYGVNYSYRVLNADYILIANPDVEFTNECIVKMRDVLIADNRCAVTSAVSLTPKGERQSVIGWKLPTHLEYILTASMLYTKLFSKMYYPKSYFENKKMCEVDCVPGSLIMVNAKLMIEYGMYDEDIFLYCEEVTLGYKLKQNGLKTILLLDQSYVHMHSVSISKSIPSIIKRRKLILKSRAIFIRKYFKASKVEMLLTRFFFMIALLENIIIYKIKGVD